MIISLRIISIVIVLLLLSTNNFAQHEPGTERGNPGSRTKGQMEGNKVRTTI